MHYKYFPRSIMQFLSIAFALILIIGLNGIIAKGSDHFEITDIAASTPYGNSGEYLRNELIKITYYVNCSGDLEGDYSYLFKENDSFELNDTPGFAPTVIYSSIGNKSNKGCVVPINKKFNGFFVPLYNDNENKSSITKIILNITPTFNCSPTFYYLTDRSFVNLVPTPNKRIPCKIRVNNSIPKIENTIISSKKGTIAEFSVIDNDSYYINWSLFKGGNELLAYTESTCRDKNSPICWYTKFNVTDFSGEMASLKIRIIDSDGGENWSPSLNNWTLSNEVGTSNSENKDMYFIISISIVLIIFSILFRTANHKYKSMYIILIVIIVLSMYKTAFFGLMITFLLMVIISYTILSVIFELEYENVSGDNIERNQAKLESRSFLTNAEKDKLGLDISGRDFLTFCLSISCSWSYIIVIATVLSINNINNSLDADRSTSSLIMIFITILLSGLGYAINPLTRPKIYISFMFLLCILWTLYIYYIAAFNIYLQGNFIAFSILIMISLFLIPINIIFHYAALNILYFKELRYG